MRIIQAKILKTRRYTKVYNATKREQDALARLEQMAKDYLNGKK